MSLQHSLAISLAESPLSSPSPSHALLSSSITPTTPTSPLVDSVALELSLQQNTTRQSLAPASLSYAQNQSLAPASLSYAQNQSLAPASLSNINTQNLRDQYLNQNSLEELNRRSESASLDDYSPQYQPRRFRPTPHPNQMNLFSPIAYNQQQTPLDRDTRSRSSRGSYQDENFHDQNYQMPPMAPRYNQPQQPGLDPRIHQQMTTRIQHLEDQLADQAERNAELQFNLHDLQYKNTDLSRELSTVRTHYETLTRIHATCSTQPLKTSSLQTTSTATAANNEYRPTFTPRPTWPLTMHQKLLVTTDTSTHQLLNRHRLVKCLLFGT